MAFRVGPPNLFDGCALMATRTLRLALLLSMLAPPLAAQGDHGSSSQAEAPAQIDGTWTLSFQAPWGAVEMGLDLTRQEDRLRGFATWGGRRIMIDRGRAEGQHVSFLIVAGDGVTHRIELEFEGMAKGDTMKGEVRGWDGPPASWQAERDRG